MEHAIYLLLTLIFILLSLKTGYNIYKLNQKQKELHESIHKYDKL